jgi:hypothetical protein
VAGGARTYLVALKFAETTATAAGQRVFDVLVDGNVVAQNLDIFAQAGANSAFDLVLAVPSSNDVMSELGFVIERSLNGTSFAVIDTVAANVTTYASLGLQPNTRYYFRVRAFNALGSSAYSNTANTRTKAK